MELNRASRQIKTGNSEMIRSRFLGVAVTASLVAFVGASPASAQNTMVAIGDSLGEGVQSADANEQTQPNSYSALIAQQFGAAFPLPLIDSWFLGEVGSTTFRSRIDPSVQSPNLAVSGADVSDVLNTAADAVTEDDIDDETDLVLFPRLGTQMEIAEAMGGDLIIAWIGSNDALAAATSFDQLDASQLTPVADFQADFAELAQRLDAMGGDVVFANVPDVTSIGFLLDRDDLIEFLGSDFGLPEGDLTSAVAMILIDSGLDDGSNLQDPNWVLDAAEAALVQDRIDDFNQIIATEAAAIGAPVVNVNGIFNFLSQNPLMIGGIPITTDFLGGLFSLDGVHPSNFGHALVAHFFIQTINARYGLGIPSVAAQFGSIFVNDPHIDKDGDGVVTGRGTAGFIETTAALAGFAGDSNDLDPGVQALRAPGVASSFTREDVIAGFKRAYSGISGDR
jgi:lysophospholipase L1-like esterase